MQIGDVPLKHCDKPVLKCVAMCPEPLMSLLVNLDFNYQHICCMNKKTPLSYLKLLLEQVVLGQDTKPQGYKSAQPQLVFTVQLQINYRVEFTSTKNVMFYSSQ